MSYKLCFIGDVMLGRLIGSKYHKKPYQIVSDSLIKETEHADFVMANLESPVVVNAQTEGDHLQFKGYPDALEQLKWIDAFSLSNNHINDCGILGMSETTIILKEEGFRYNGLFKNEYQPLIIEKEKIAIVTITDMMNIPFADKCEWDVLRVGEKRVFDILRRYHDDGFFVILYAHIGILFSRYPNPVSRDYLHQCVDAGANAIVTAHSHCLGCMETYKGVPIFHSLGDYVMDGNSYRRRRSGMLFLEIKEGKINNYEIVPAEIDDNLMTGSPSEKIRRKMLQDYEKVSSQLSRHHDDYESFFKWQYKKEMLLHTGSTLCFLYHTKGVFGLLKMVSKRFEEVGRMVTWMAKDRSKDQRDDDAIRANRKKFTEKELFDC